MIFSSKDVIIFYIEAKEKNYTLIVIEIKIVGMTDKRRDTMERSIRVSFIFIINKRAKMCLCLFSNSKHQRK